MDELMRGRVVVAGEATGEVLLSSQPLSFWGGYDHRTGEIIDRRHPLSGQIAAGRILATPMLPKSVQVLMTNSAKYAYYVPGLLAAQVVFGSMADCVASAAEGRVVRDESLWMS